MLSAGTGYGSSAPSRLAEVEALCETHCLRAARGRQLTVRVLRQRSLGPGLLPPSNDIIIVQHLGGGSWVERRRGDRVHAAQVPRGAVTVVPAGQETEWRLPETLEVLHLYMAGELPRRLAERDLGVDPNRVEIVDSFAAEDPLTVALARTARASLDDQTGNDGGFDSLFMDCLAQTVALHLLRRHAVLPPHAWPADPSALSPERLKRVCDYVEAHLAEEVTLDQLAEAASLSTFHLSRCFRRATGLTLHGYLMQRRVERARVLLQDRRLGLAQVAYACGFASQSHFTAVFKRRTGATPGLYRRSVL